MAKHTKQEMATAYHEAGHAVMSILHGQPVVSVDVHEVDGRGGIMWSQVYRYQLQPTTIRAFISMSEITLAGPLAAGIFDCGCGGVLDEIFGGVAPHWLEGSLWGGANDFSILRPYAAKLWPNTRWRARQVNELAFETIRRLTRYEVWRAVEDVADALQDAGEVDQWRLERITQGLASGCQ